MIMMVLVSYDVSTSDSGGQRRLRRVARVCKNYGQRVQYSVFECIVDPAMWTFLRKQLEEEIDPAQDSLRFYFLGANWRRRVEHVGAKPSFDQEGPLVA
jgi:CRISPR-associated protein Cas2